MDSSSSLIFISGAINLASTSAENCEGFSPSTARAVIAANSNSLRNCIESPEMYSLVAVSDIGDYELEHVDIEDNPVVAINKQPAHGRRHEERSDIAIVWSQAVVIPQPNALVYKKISRLARLSV